MDLISKVRSLRYRGRQIAKGERFSAPTGHAKVLIATGRAERASAPQTYATRDMRAAPRLPQLDRDNDGHPGGSLPIDKEGLGEARRAYREKFGKNAGPRWDAATIHAKIAEA